MLNILHGEFYKLRKSRAFYVCILAAAGLVLMLYGALIALSNIRESGQGLVITSGEEILDADGNPIPLMQQIGIMGILQQMFSGHLMAFMLVAFISIFVITEFAGGAVKNIVGKGYSRETVFWGKLLTAVLASALMTLLTAFIAVLFGLPFMGREGIQAVNWPDVVIYTGMQIVFGISFTGIITLVGELTRSLAAGISISAGILIFSNSLMTVLDVLCRNFGWQPSRYWILELQGGFPINDFEPKIIVQGLAVSLVWFLAAAAVGTLHFRKADVK